MSEPEGRSRPATALMMVGLVALLAAWSYMLGTSRDPQPTPTSPPATDSRPVIVDFEP